MARYLLDRPHIYEIIFRKIPKWYLTSIWENFSKCLKAKRILLYRILLAAGMPPAHPLKMLEALIDRFPTE